MKRSDNRNNCIVLVPAVHKQNQMLLFIATLRISANGRSRTRGTGSARGKPQGAVTPSTNLQGQSPKLVLLEAEAKEHLTKELASKG